MDTMPTGTCHDAPRGCIKEASGLFPPDPKDRPVSETFFHRNGIEELRTGTPGPRRQTTVGIGPCLVVDQVPSAGERVQALIAELNRSFGLDAATSRQRLLGRGPALLARGERERLEEIAEALDETGWRHWLIEPTPPSFAPARVRELRIDDQEVVFRCDGQEIPLQRGDRVLAVLADLSGQIVGRSRKRAVARQTYRGTTAPPPGDDGKTYREVLLYKPILDLYLLSEKGKVRTAIRFFPGRFKTEGLGERASLSGSGNLDQLVRLARQYAGSFSLNTDFGLAKLPGCRPRKDADGRPDLQANLAALTRYGWLLADLQAETLRNSSPEDASQGIGLGPVLLGAVGHGEALGSGSLDEPAGSAGERDAETEGIEARPPLPQPPERGDDREFLWRRRTLMIGGGVLAFMALQGTGAAQSVLPFFKRYGLQSGAVPALLSTALFLAAFHYLRLKRMVENTPTSKVRSLAMGMVELKGKAVRQYALVSPLTQIPCVFYRLRKYRRNAKGHWNLVRQTDSSHVPFFLKDETGRVSISPARARITPRHRRTGNHTGDAFVLLDGPLAGRNNEKYEEEIIFENNDLYVLGFATVRHGERKSLRQRTAEALRRIKQDPAAMRAFDTDGDGRIDAGEWDAARRAMEEKSLRQSLTERNGQKDRVVITRARGMGLPFIISETASETRLTRKYGLLIGSLLLTALAAAVWASIALLRHLGT